MNKKTLAAGAVAAAAVVLAGGNPALASASITGPSSSQSPYVVGTTPGVVTKSLLTVGDTAPNGYQMVGIPDGMGAYDNGDGTFTILMNHELRPGTGAVRAHGADGAFVSKWVVNTKDLSIVSGEDLIQTVMLANADGGWTDTVTSLNRLCSADLADQSAFYNSATGKGTQTKIFLNGEEAGAEGRAFATVVDGADAGTAYELPWMGKASWENIVAMPNSGDQTVVVALDDSGGGQVYVYVGQKQSTGNDVERAGLVGGKLYGLQIEGVATENDSTVIPESGVGFNLIEIEGAAAMTGAQLEAASNELGVTQMARPEDGAWDPTDPDAFYFVTTGAFQSISRMWHLNFADIANAASGGAVTVPVSSPAYDPALPAAEQQGPRMMDNLTVNANGQVLVQEDPGGTPYLAGIFQYDPKSGAVAKIAQHDPNRFAPGAAGLLTTDEESSGIIPAPFLGSGKYLIDVQAHYSTDPVTVQGGQLLVLQVPKGKPVR